MVHTVLHEVLVLEDHEVLDNEVLAPEVLVLVNHEVLALEDHAVLVLEDNVAETDEAVTEDHVVVAAIDDLVVVAVAVVIVQVELQAHGLFSFHFFLTLLFLNFIIVQSTNVSAYRKRHSTLVSNTSLVGYENR